MCPVVSILSSTNLTHAQLNRSFWQVVHFDSNDRSLVKSLVISHPHIRIKEFAVYGCDQFHLHFCDCKISSRYSPRNIKS